MTRKRSLILSTTGATAVGVVALLGIFVGPELRIRWTCERAKRELLAEGGRTDEPPPALARHVGANEAAYAVLGRLLLDDDPAVWIHVLKHTHWNEGARRSEWESWEAISPFEAHLRDHEPVAWLKYLLLPPYQHGTDWRGEGSTLAFDYWSGRAGQLPAPEPRTLAFIRSFLAGRAEETYRVEGRFLRPDLRLDLERRAVYALRAMVAARPPPAAAVELLRWTLAEHRYPAVRLAALAALTVVQNPCGEEPPCVSSPWWEPCELEQCVGDLHILEKGLGRLRWAASDHAEHRLELLAHLDSAWMLWVLLRLRSRADLAGAVERALGPERGVWPVGKPAWLPLEAAAARYLASPSLDDRAAALLVLVELGTPAARDVLAAHEAREAHAELRLLTRSGLAALGDERQRAAPEAELIGRLDARDPRRRLLGAARWPWCVESPGGGWAEPYRIATGHLARHLLIAGSRAALERLVRSFLDGGESCIDLTLHVDGLPLTPWSEVEDDSDPLRFVSIDREDEQEKLSAWWRANAGRLQWDAFRRRFAVSTAPGPR